MKSELNNITSQEIGFPRLMVYDNTSGKGIFVVLFHEEDCGTVVYSENEQHKIGAYLESWAIKYFKPFTGEIKLTN